MNRPLNNTSNTNIVTLANNNEYSVTLKPPIFKY